MAQISPSGQQAIVIDLDDLDAQRSLLAPIDRQLSLAELQAKADDPITFCLDKYPEQLDTCAHSLDYIQLSSAGFSDALTNLQSVRGIYLQSITLSEQLVATWSLSILAVALTARLVYELVQLGRGNISFAALGFDIILYTILTGAYVLIVKLVVAFYLDISAYYSSEVLVERLREHLGLLRAGLDERLDSGGNIFSLYSSNMVETVLTVFTSFFSFFVRIFQYFVLIAHGILFTIVIVAGTIVVPVSVAGYVNVLGGWARLCATIVLYPIIQALLFWALLLYFNNSGLLELDNDAVLVQTFELHFIENLINISIVIIFLIAPFATNVIVTGSGNLSSVLTPMYLAGAIVAKQAATTMTGAMAKLPSQVSGSSDKFDDVGGSGGNSEGKQDSGSEATLAGGESLGGESSNKSASGSGDGTAGGGDAAGATGAGAAGAGGAGGGNGAGGGGAGYGGAGGGGAGGGGASGGGAAGGGGAGDGGAGEASGGSGSDSLTNEAEAGEADGSDSLTNEADEADGSDSLNNEADEADEAGGISASESLANKAGVGESIDNEPDLSKMVDVDSGVRSGGDRQTDESDENESQTNEALAGDSLADNFGIGPGNEEASMAGAGNEGASTAGPGNEEALTAGLDNEGALTAGAGNEGASNEETLAGLGNEETLAASGNEEASTAAPGNEGALAGASGRGDSPGSTALESPTNFGDGLNQSSAADSPEEMMLSGEESDNNTAQEVRTDFGDRPDESSTANSTTQRSKAAGGTEVISTGVGVEQGTDTDKPDSRRRGRTTID
ncbi:MAG: hypothetical protein K0U66_05355 [Gammaproteobacteria bacterium]|nr:hypothetical protein [Gammaproteobacteria bacterium]